MVARRSLKANYKVDSRYTDKITVDMTDIQLLSNGLEENQGMLHH